MNKNISYEHLPKSLRMSDVCLLKSLQMSASQKSLRMSAAQKSLRMTAAQKSLRMCLPKSLRMSVSQNLYTLLNQHTQC